MRRKILQAKHLPDQALLDAIELACERRGHPTIGATWWEIARLLPGMPAKVIMAKARRLIDRGLMHGCTCWCRGDFVVHGSRSDWYCAHDDARRSHRARYPGAAERPGPINP